MYIKSVNIHFVYLFFIKFDNFKHKVLLQIKKDNLIDKGYQVLTHLIFHSLLTFVN